MGIWWVRRLQVHNDQDYAEKEKVIKSMYITKEGSSAAELAKKFGVSKVTIYDDIKTAEERLSALFFGINGLRFY